MNFGPEKKKTTGRGREREREAKLTLLARERLALI